MRFGKRLTSFAFTAFSVVALASCSGASQDTENPVINSISIPEKIYIGQTVNIIVDASDNVTSYENLRFSYRVTNGLNLVECVDGKFTVADSGIYTVQVDVYDQSNNYASKSVNFTALDAGKGWTTDEKAMFTSYFNRVLPFPAALETANYIVEEVTLTNSKTKALRLTATDFEATTIAEDYGAFLENVGFTLYGKTTQTALDEVTTYPIYFYTKHFDDEADKEKFLVMQVDYFPGYSEDSDYYGTVEPTFEFYAYYKSFAYESYESNKWESTIVSNALMGASVASTIPAYVATGDNPKFYYQDRHKSSGQGSLYIEISGTNTSDLSDYCDSLDDAGFLGAWYEDLVSNDQNNTIFLMEDNLFVMYIKNDLNVDGKVKMNILYASSGE